MEKVFRLSKSKIDDYTKTFGPEFLPHDVGVVISNDNIMEYKSRLFL